MDKQDLLNERQELIDKKNHLSEKIRKIEKELHNLTLKDAKKKKNNISDRNIEIFKMYEAGKSKNDIALETGLSYGSICVIIDKVKNWKKTCEKYPDYKDLSTHLRNLLLYSKYYSKSDLIDHLENEGALIRKRFFGKATQHELDDFVGFDTILTGITEAEIIREGIRGEMIHFIEDCYIVKKA